MNKQLTFIGIALILGLGIGYSIGFYKGSFAINSKLQSQIDKAKQFFPTLDEVRSVSGTVKSINGNVITIEANNFNPFEELPTIREVVAAADTKIIKLEEKAPEEFEKEFEDYQKKTAEQSQEALVPPSLFREKEITLTDLKAGNMISAEADKDIKTSARFEAVKVIVQR